MLKWSNPVQCPLSYISVTFSCLRLTREIYGSMTVLMFILNTFSQWNYQININGLLSTNS